MIRPGYWTDADLHTRLSAEVREFYIGLWMEADDAGFVDWDPIRVGADLYPYRGLAWRSKNIPRWVEALGPHVRILDCGKHLVVPNLEKHQSPPRPSYPNKRAHEKCGLQRVAHDPKCAQVGPSAGREGKGREGKGFGLNGGAAAQPSENDGETTFQRLVPRTVALP
jgi:hypothetical protein